MTDRVPERSFNRMTWGDFVALLRPHGITVEVLPVPVKSSRGLMVPGYHLVRQDPKPTTTYPLPLNYRIDARVGVEVIYSVCRHFEIEPRFPGWLLIM
jgi:hypothetical protein